ncbi:MAG: hypothetical protein WC655_06620 [Candidatus Hydrogenedentales bacterium]|jgi:hypothetical protein
MSEWTPEAQEYLDGYLAQVRALARQGGEDADELAAELREHIEREAEESTGSVVTLDHLRKVLAAVGTPEQTASAESLLARRDADPSARDEGPSPQFSTTSEQQPPYTDIQAPPLAARGRSRSGCWAALVGMFLFALLGIVVWTFAASFQWSQIKKGKIYADEKAVVKALQDIHAGEKRYFEEKREDTDGDGVSDYGSLADLFKQGLIKEDYAGETHYNHIFNVSLTPSAKTGTPSFVCEATPMFEEYARVFTIDETGEVQMTPRSKDEKPLAARQFINDRAEMWATDVLRHVLNAEKIYLETTAKDKDSDGVPDYATTADLQDADKALASEYYIVNVTTRDSASNNGTPEFSCVAQPRPSYSHLPTYSIDQTGVITSVAAETTEAESTSTQNGTGWAPVVR